MTAMAWPFGSPVVETMLKSPADAFHPQLRSLEFADELEEAPPKVLAVAAALPVVFPDRAVTVPVWADAVWL